MDVVLQEIVTLLTDGITAMATGIGGGLQALVSNIFLDTTGDTQKLSVFGGIIVVFCGISLAVGLSKFIVNWVTSLGN